MHFTPFRSFVTFGLLLLAVQIHAQMFPPGKLVQIKQETNFPFAPLAIDSLKGRAYILMSTGLGLPRLGKSALSWLKSDTTKRINGGKKVESTKNNNRAISGSKKWRAMKKSNRRKISLTDSLISIYREQISPDTLLVPWVGKRFSVIDFEKEPTIFQSVLSDYYILAKFSDTFTAVLKVFASDLETGGMQLIPTATLDSARARWIGRNLWINVSSGISKFPVFSKAKVLSIDPSLYWKGPYAFHLLSENGDTATVYCKLQKSDSSLYSFSVISSFGHAFLDNPPETYWKTLPGTVFESDGIAVGEDSAAFFQKMKMLDVRTISYNVTYSMSGHDSEATAELRGKGIWGMPFDSSHASFSTGKLSAIGFVVYDSESQVAVRADLHERYGEPSISDTARGYLGQTSTSTETWLYYTAAHRLEEIVFVDMGSLLTSLRDLNKITNVDFPSSLMIRGMVGYGDAEMQNSALR
jgi:hypothetical protein